MIYLDDKRAERILKKKKMEKNEIKMFNVIFFFRFL